MKKWLFIILIIGFLAILSETSWPLTGSGLENPAVRSPVVSGTVPPTSFRSGLIQSPDPIDTSGNLIITGNVTGGKHFRGLVPYGSTTNFQAPLGTSALDSFLRSSADSTDFSRYGDPSRPYYSPTEASTGGYRPFFSPTGTVTTTRAGLSGTLTPATTRIRPPFLLSQESRGAGDLALPALPDGQSLSGLDSSNLQMSLRPMSRTPQEMEKLISDELSGTMPQLSALEHLRSARLPRNISRTEQYQEQIEQFRPELGRIDDKASLLKESLNRDPGYSSSEAEYLRRTDGARVTRESAPAETSRIEHPAKRFETQLSKQQSSRIPALPGTSPSLQGRPALRRASGREMFPSDLAELDKLISAAEKKAERFPRSGGPELRPKQTGKQLDVYEQIKRRLDDLVQSDTPAASRLRSKPAGDNKRKRDLSGDSQESRIDFDVSRKRPEILRDTSARAKAILGEHKSYDSFSEDKFNLYIKAAQVYLKQGRYYRAVDSFTLASIFGAREEVGLAYLGKSHALFAAGEYISSALFLSRALELDTRYSQLNAQAESRIKNRESSLAFWV